MSGRTFTLIPAAGKSTRMGRPKLSLPLGERTVLERVIAAVRKADIADILVVLGPHVAALGASAVQAGANVLSLAEETLDMRATVEHGLDWLESHCAPTEDDAWLLIPADHPTLDAAVVRSLLAKRQEQPFFSIFIPSFAGQRGHPTLIGWKHRRHIRAIPHGLGLNWYLRAHTAATLEVAQPSPEILCDLDTPEDYARLLARLKSENGF